ncbi:ATP synthase subunit I [uncultured Faecalicoccus sp.]|uniref:ATP synthase subunit I n=1 Tax=uncultured Faecalicoccus sp. TaxID=1971760 RepID=UPI0026348545|nr:ATP synthase subunit I [uncultured Faecalicoccus sp.]
MNELQLMNKKIEILSVVLGVLAALIAGLLFKDLKIAIAVVLGLVIALIGYAMIVRMTVTMGDDDKLEKQKGTRAYLSRYLLYICFFGAAAYFGFSVIALLAGFLCHKLAILVYALQLGRMDHDA